MSDYQGWIRNIKTREIVINTLEGTYYFYEEFALMCTIIEEYHIQENEIRQTINELLKENIIKEVYKVFVDTSKEDILFAIPEDENIGYEIGYLLTKNIESYDLDDYVDPIDELIKLCS